MNIIGKSCKQQKNKNKWPKHKKNLTRLQKCKTKLMYHFYLDLLSETSVKNLVID